jgi:phenylalanyl-tRNA synthetase beta chain
MLVPYDWLKEFVPVDLPPRKLAHKLDMIGLEVERIEEVEGSPVFDVSVTSNRGDCLSTLGIAREAAAAIGFPLCSSVAGGQEQTETGPDISDLGAIEILAPDLCPRYSAALVLETRAIPSPEWAQRRLRQCGLRAINALVDVTNLVMLELGQPLHAFDYDLLAKDEDAALRSPDTSGRSTRGRARIIVRRAQPGEQLQTLDGVERALSGDMLVIADRKGAVALAGIMGGASTEVTSRTRSVLIESAHFDRIAIRRASRALGIPSESSYRFERIVDPGGTVRAALRAAQLMVEFAGGRAAAGVLDEWPVRQEPARIVVRPRRVNQVLGIRISAEKMVQHLRGLGLEVEYARSEIGNSKPEIRNIIVSVPSFRPDLREEIDIAEEVARLHGYERIRAKLAPSPVIGKLSPELKLQEKLRSLLLGLGLTETRTFSLDSPSVFDRLKIPEGHHLRNAPSLTNPKSEEYSILRTTLLASLLRTVSTNVYAGLDDIHVFEIGRIYLPSSDDQPRDAVPSPPKEQRTLGIAMRGSPWTSAWNIGGDSAYSDFFAVKGVVERVVSAVAGREADFETGDHPSLRQDARANVKVDGEEIGFVGEAGIEVLQEFGIGARSLSRESRAPTGGVFLLQINLDALFRIAAAPKAGRFARPSRFPPARRDIALVVPDEVPYAKVERVISQSAGEWLERVWLFDEYSGEQLTAHGFENHKSLAFHLVFRHPERTLTGGEVDVAMQQIKAALEDKGKLGATIRDRDW